MLKLTGWIARIAVAAAAALSGGCTAISFAIANTPASFGPYQRTAGIAYGPDRRQKLDVYVPDDPAQRFPAVVRAADVLLEVQRAA